MPLYLLGMSLGGLVVLDYALHHPDGLRGVIALSPPLGALGVPAPLLALGRVMSRVWPRFSLETAMDLSGLSRDPAIVERVLADPLFHRRGTARLSTEVTRTIARVQSEAGRFAVPLLVQHGAADRMVPPDGSRRFVRRGWDIRTADSSSIRARITRCSRTSTASGCSRISPGGPSSDCEQIPAIGSFNQ